jgi:cold shock CspA family protein
MKGIIKFYKQQGYGFIAGEDNKDYFFHISNVDQQYKQDVKNGQPVIFVPLKTRRGDTAKSISFLQEIQSKCTDDYLSEIEVKKNIIFSKNVETIGLYFCLAINILLLVSFRLPNIVLLLSLLLLIALLSILYLKYNDKK